MVHNIAIPDLFEKTDCESKSDEEIAELHKIEILKQLKIYSNKKTIAMNTHIVVITGD